MKWKKSKYRRLTKDRGEVPKRGKVGCLPIPLLDEELLKNQRRSYLDTVCTRPVTIDIHRNENNQEAEV
jgi:hypothetical protein